ncbi:MAG: DUF2062 domain-containing protein [Verrucomicrobiota bacterium]|nr:DUF2062 domain-containing protein [Verrucomicrobiota bacterium]
MTPTPSPLEGPPLPGPLARFKGWLVSHHMTLMAINDTPHSIALGSAIGMFFGFTPLLSIKTLGSIGTAWVCRSNKVAAAIAVTLHDVILPFMPAIYFFEYRMGYWILHGTVPHRRLKNLGWADYFNWHAFSRWVWPTLVGSLFLAVPFALGVYFLLRMLVSQSQARRAAAQSA